jgi:hypothetical protein
MERFGPDWDESWYFDICSDGFDDFPAVTIAEAKGLAGVTNMRYGGRNPMTLSAHFTVAADDLDIGVMIGDSVEWRSIAVDKSAKGNSGAALREPREGEDPKLTKSRDFAIKKMVDWMNGMCNASCDHGKCVSDSCICDTGYYGDMCEKVQTTLHAFETLLGLSTVGIVGVLLLSGLVSWSTVMKEADREENRMSRYTESMLGTTE